MREYIDPNLSKLSVRKDLRVTVKRIAADRNEYIYDLADKVFRDAFPEYFQNQVIHWYRVGVFWWNIKAPFDYVLYYCDTIILKTPKSREKNEGRRYLDSCGIIITEYKWTTQNHEMKH